MASQRGPAPPRRNRSRVSAAASTRPSPGRAVKRPRSSESPVCLSSAPCLTAAARRQLFDALERGDRCPGMPRLMADPGHLSEMQLARCFDVLHACGRATDAGASRATTRQSIDGFFDAVFNAWTSESAGDLLRPELDFLVEADVVAGRICVCPDAHADIAACRGSGMCKVDVSAVATYSCNPAMAKLEFTMVDPFTGQPEALCALGRSDIRWVASDWARNLRQTLRSRIESKLRKFNKHLAIWHARKLIVAWSRGSVDLGGDVDKLGFLSGDEAARATMGFALGEQEGP